MTMPAPPRSFVFPPSRGRWLRRTACLLLAAVILAPVAAPAQSLLIPMDETQQDHLKAYGVAFHLLTRGVKVEWLLNYRGGSFLANYYADIADTCDVRGVVYDAIGDAQVAAIKATIEDENMESVLLEKAPAIAIYAPSGNEPWDDAVTLALTYAQINYTVIWDEEVLNGDLDLYDWLHLHHEDFTGQYGKFYGSYRNELWYRQDVQMNEAMAQKLGFRKASDLKLAVALTIKSYVTRGGFLFAMCSAPETLDIALAAGDVDIVPSPFDGDPPDPNCQAGLDYSRSMAFTDFTLSLDPNEYSHSDIDTSPDRISSRFNPAGDYFRLFEFSAKLDPVPTMLVQCHVDAVSGFMGQTTAFRKSLVKKYVILLGENEGQNEVRYLHGNLDKGTFTFLGGHDPEDYQHLIYDPPTELALHKNSPGYRLILNNVLFPAARKKDRKT
ncbi:MAG TPA: asparagine synthetase B [Acidobacteriota bacterium]|nr:asparagine synthetase B [Acidobacteriota bacterium]